MITIPLRRLDRSQDQLVSIETILHDPCGLAMHFAAQLNKDDSISYDRSEVVLTHVASGSYLFKAPTQRIIKAALTQLKQTSIDWLQEKPLDWLHIVKHDRNVLAELRTRLMSKR